MFFYCDLIPKPSPYTKQKLDFIETSIKCYNNFGMVQIIKFKEGFFVRLGPRFSKDKITSGNIESLNFIRSVQRSKSIIRDYCLENSFEWFATFTFANRRDDLDFCRQSMQKFLRQLSRYHPIKYIIVPEFHKDKKSLHFHALISGIPTSDLQFSLFPSGDHRLSKRGNPYYEHPYFKNYYGINVFERIEKTPDSQLDIASYISKYITKDMPLFFGRKRYWCSRNLNKPSTLRFPFIDVTGIDSAFIVKDNSKITIFELPIDEFTKLNKKS